MPEGVRRRDPGRPRVGRHRRRRREGPDPEARGRPGGLGFPEPSALPTARRSGERLVPRTPALRRGEGSNRHAQVVLPPSGVGSRAQLSRAKKTLERAENVLGALPLRGKQAEWTASHRGETRGKRSRRSATSSSTAPTRELRSGLRPRSPLGPLGRPDPRGPRRVLLRSTRHRLGRFHGQRLPSVGRAAGAGAHHPRWPHQPPGAKSGCASRCWPPNANSPPSTCENTLIAWNSAWRAMRSWPLDGCPATSASASPRL